MCTFFRHPVGLEGVGDGGRGLKKVMSTIEWQFLFQKRCPSRGASINYLMNAWGLGVVYCRRPGQPGKFISSWI